MTFDMNTILYVAIGLGALFTLVMGCGAIGLVAWLLLRPGRRPVSALASAKKLDKTELDEDQKSVLQLFDRHRDEVRLDQVRGQMVEAAQKKA